MHKNYCINGIFNLEWLANLNVIRKSVCLFLSILHHRYCNTIFNMKFELYFFNVFSNDSYQKVYFIMHICLTCWALLLWMLSSLFVIAFVALWLWNILGCHVPLRMVQGLASAFKINRKILGTEAFVLICNCQHNDTK